MSTNDAQRPQLSLGDPPPGLKRPSSGVSRGWLAALLLLQVVTVGGLAAVLLRRPGGTGTAAGAGAAPADPAFLKAVATALEDKSLDAEAAAAWEQYLAACPDASDRAEVWYRVGKLHLQAEQYDRAAAALVRCEQSAGDDAPLRAKVGPLLVTCLRRSGRYGEVDRELSRRVEAGAGDVKHGPVLASLAGESLTQADLDRMLERQVDEMLALQGQAGNEAARQQLLQEAARPELRRQVLLQWLRTELFTRRARELGLDKDEEFRAQRQSLEERLLASRFETRELGKIEPTDVDLESFLKAQEERYRQPESLQVVLEPLQPDEKPQALLEKIKSAEDFKKFVAERHPGDAGAAATAPQTLVRGSPHPQLGNADALFALEAGRWTTEPIVHNEKRYLVLVDSKQPARVPALDEIRPQVQADYVARKRQELSQKLLDDLMLRYQVKITEDRPAETPAADGGAGAAAKTPASKGKSP